MSAPPILPSRISLRASRFFLNMWVGCAAILSAGHFLHADELDPPGLPDEAQRHSLRLATDRKTTLVLERLFDHLAGARSDEAFEDFRRLQTSEASVMVPASPDDAQFVPLYKRVFEVFHKLPDRHRQRISEAGNFAANRDLQNIIKESRFESIPHLILKFAGTEASLKAHILLARLHMERGNTLGVKAWLQPLCVQNVDDSYRQTALKILKGLSNEHDKNRVNLHRTHQVPRSRRT